MVPLSSSRSPSSNPPPTAISIGTACGVAATMKADAEWYFNEAMGRKMHEFIYEEVSVILASDWLSEVR